MAVIDATQTTRPGEAAPPIGQSGIAKREVNPVPGHDLTQGRRE
jgi:hypothetical protein